MIFSFSLGDELVAPPHREKLDVFCFFNAMDAIRCPEEFWFEAVCSSLRMKHEVLLLEKNRLLLPQWDESKRWMVGEDWCWLAPRSLSTLRSEAQQNPWSYPTFKHFLLTHK